MNDKVRRNGFQKMSTDLAVPIANSREMMRWYQERLERDFPGKFVIFGPYRRRTCAREHPAGNPVGR